MEVIYESAGSFLLTSRRGRPDIAPDVECDAGIREDRRQYQAMVPDGNRGMIAAEVVSAEV